uniref:lys-63-specific deubiquitinase-like n=1 Tax=Myxine glutinosa TaxID=7769 RepID=UPI00358E7CBC
MHRFIPSCLQLSSPSSCSWYPESCGDAVALKQLAFSSFCTWSCREVPKNINVIFESHKPSMVLDAVHINTDAFLVCLLHALSTENEEVMGLCIGEVDCEQVVHVMSVMILRRSDKRKDRVEISPEQLSAATTKAEHLSAQSGRTLRVIGWYHSHPHITVWPSHVGTLIQWHRELWKSCINIC